jgi:hypothetical protein
LIFKNWIKKKSIHKKYFFLVLHSKKYIYCIILRKETILRFIHQVNKTIALGCHTYTHTHVIHVYLILAKIEYSYFSHWKIEISTNYYLRKIDQYVFGKSSDAQNETPISKRKWFLLYESIYVCHNLIVIRLYNPRELFKWHLH